MNQPLLTLLLAAAAIAAAEKKVDMKSLPAAVRTAIENEAKGAQIRGVSSEKEDGKVVYEAETTLANGRKRDFQVDASGKVVETELETPIDEIPAPAKAAILKTVGSGTITIIETVAEKGQTFYEAGYKRDGKKREMQIRADGTVIHDGKDQ